MSADVAGGGSPQDRLRNVCHLRSLPFREDIRELLRDGHRHRSFASCWGRPIQTSRVPGGFAPLAAMKIRSHAESHIVELDDGSRWQIFPGDIDLTLNWKPETDLTVVVDDQVSTHAMVGGSAKVRVIAADEKWPVRGVKSALKDG
jgi:hypothetical protein